MAWEKSGVPAHYAVTKWFAYDVPGMWRAIENQQGDDHWRLVSGWRRTAELTGAHLRRLQTYRTKLAEAWSPERNAAAAAYVGRLDFLVQNVQTTYEVAVANYTTFATAVGALTAARQELKPIHDKYVGMKQVIQEHENLVAHNRLSEAPTVIGQPPATQMDLDLLNYEARAIMYDLSHTLVEAEAAIRQPPTYLVQSRMNPGNPDVYGEGGASQRPPMPPAATSIATGSSDNGVANGVATPPPLERSATSGSPAIQGSGPIVPFVPRALPVDRRSVTNPSAIAGQTTTRPSLNGPTRPAWIASGASRPLPPGGVIGAVPAIHPGQPAVAPQPGRINPVGGVIGGPHPGGSSQLGGPIAGAMTTGPTVGQRRSPESRARRWDPDRPWETAEGVTPVIRPSREAHQFDPGPVIGLGA